MIYLFLAEGFEEIEAFTQADLLRRAGLDVKCVSVESYPVISGAHKIKVMADCTISEITVSADDMILLPGGMPGVENLYACKELTALIKSHYDEGGRIAAICAAPIILEGSVFSPAKWQPATPDLKMNFRVQSILTARLLLTER